MTQLLLVVAVGGSTSTPTGFAATRRASLLGLHGRSSRSDFCAGERDARDPAPRRELYLALPIVVLASFPVVQIVHVLPDLPRTASSVSAETKSLVEYAVLAWMFIIAMRAVYVCTDPARSRRKLWAAAGGLLLIAPFWFAPLLGPLEPWWREIDASVLDPGAISPASEAVLAAQQFMLDRALDQLDEERPGVSDLYFVAFAPDARRAGFIADVDAAQRTMDERWDTQGRSVVMLNSPATVAERPFASITHLRQVLLEIGDIIDADDDVVMVYVTGNSGADHTLTAVNPPLELAALSPQGMKQLFDAANIRWRIVVSLDVQAERGSMRWGRRNGRHRVIGSRVRGGDCTGLRRCLRRRRCGDA